MVSIPDGYGQISLVHSGANISGEAVITMGFQNTVDEDAVTVGDSFKTAFVASDILLAYSSSCDIVEVRVKLGPTATGETGIVDLGLVGDIGGQPVSPNVAMLVRKNTSLGGRRGRGRMYVPGTPGAGLDNSGEFDAGQVNQWVGEWTDIWAGMTFVGFTPMLLHEGALTPTPINNFVGSTRVATQRRRARR